MTKQRLSPSRDARQGLVLLFGIIALMWVLEGINSIDHNALDSAGGIYPRNFDHLWAIFTSPFLHQNFSPHLIDNTVPLAFMGVIIALRGALRLAAVTLIVVIVGGLGTWVASPSGSVTIGASGIVFGYATYLLARGLFNRSILEIAVGFIVGVVWGGALIYSIVPHAGVSWQAHVSGAVGGVIAAWILASPHAGLRRGRDSGGVCRLGHGRAVTATSAGGRRARPARRARSRALVGGRLRGPRRLVNRVVGPGPGSLRNMRIFSGIQPTGRKHLGNYIGAITQYVAGQDRGEGSTASSTCTR